MNLKIHYIIYRHIVTKDFKVYEHEAPIIHPEFKTKLEAEEWLKNAFNTMNYNNLDSNYNYYFFIKKTFTPDNE